MEIGIQWQTLRVCKSLFADLRNSQNEGKWVVLKCNFFLHSTVSHHETLLRLCTLRLTQTNEVSHK